MINEQLDRLISLTENKEFFFVMNTNTYLNLEVSTKPFYNGIEMFINDDYVNGEVLAIEYDKGYKR